MADAKVEGAAIQLGFKLVRVPKGATAALTDDCKRMSIRAIDRNDLITISWYLLYVKMVLQ